MEFNEQEKQVIDCLEKIRAEYKEHAFVEKLELIFTKEDLILLLKASIGITHHEFDKIRFINEDLHLKLVKS